jgi:ribosomal protein L20
MLNAQKEKGRSKNSKGDYSASEQQLKQAQEDYQEEATLFLFRLKSLKQGQFRSLFTQAARHHAAQVHILVTWKCSSFILFFTLQKLILSAFLGPAKFVQKGCQVP